MITIENQQDAACNDVEDPDMFFVEVGDVLGVARAKALCATCPIAINCLETAMEDPDARKFGIWGGTTPNERANMVRNSRTRLKIVTELKESSERNTRALREWQDAVRKVKGYTL